MNTMARWVLCTLVLSSAAVAAAGCGEGALHVAVATADTCPPGGDCTHAGFDAPVAVGAVVHPEFQTKLAGSAGAGFRFVSASPDVLDVDGGEVVGKSPGLSALLLVTDGETVVDFLHVWVKTATKVRVAATAPGREKAMITSGPIELLVGDAIFVSAELTADGQRLIGAAPSAWEADEGVLSVLREGNEGHRRVVALHPGSTSLRVKTLGLESEIDVVVRAGEPSVRGRSL